MFDATIIPLWPENSPHHVETENGLPRMELYFPFDEVESDAPKPVVLVCPGGGYHKLAPHEGFPVANLFREHGYVTGVIYYRVAPHGFPAPMADAARAIRLIRSKADELKIDPDHICLCGFSAGGHLTATIGTQPDIHKDPEDDLVSSYDCQPNQLGLFYPVISMHEEHHQGSANNLLGDDASEDSRKAFSNELHVKPTNPPTFLFHTAEDTAVLPSNSMRYFNACLANNVPAELHIYQTGAHGIGLAVDNKAIRTWSDLFLRWLEQFQEKH